MTFRDKRRHKIDNYVTGRWVLTIKVDKDGQFKKFKARKRLDTVPVTHRRVYTRLLQHKRYRLFASVCAHRPLFGAQGLPRYNGNRIFTSIFVHPPYFGMGVSGLLYSIFLYLD